MAFALAFLLMPTSAAVSGDCRVMRVDRAAGAVIRDGDTIATSCPVDVVRPKLRYDSRRRIAVARKALSAGEALGRAYLPSPPGVLPGDTVRLVARLGHVVIERRMTALQPAWANQRFFARDPQGKIVVAPRLAAPVTP